ncbi:hypothetical protein AB0I81_25790 [Nonomuraea sp. NPDC050404]|uniref:hypothetical protein n=1 Tax=Nonomuraea sp. NPDC050404 TaxID=3155783 RepID=UPI00340ABC7C
MPFLLMPEAAAASGGTVDTIAFGDPASERAHDLAGAFTSVVDGALRERARVANPTVPPEVKGGELRFDMKVDPVAQNYLTVKFWGGDVSAYRTIAYINGEQIGYRGGGDYEAINSGYRNSLPGRFYYKTILLPLGHTQGQRVVEITLRTYEPSFAKPVTENSRGYYRAYTHTGAYLDVSGEPQGGLAPDTTPAPGPSEADKQAMIDGYTAGQVALFNTYSSRVDAGPSAKLSIVRYQDELRFYAHALLADWSPADGPEPKRAALNRIFKVIDNHVKDYYANTRLLLRGGHQGDWGGYYGALGEALYIVENLIKDEGILGERAFEAFLREPFTTGTQDGETSLKDVDWDGGPLDRGEAWERVLKANFDFARSRQSYITNQVLYTYEGAWEAHEGLRLVGSRFYEGKARSHRILLEALGAEPWLGEEVLTGPDGGELDVYHSLFYHDANARFTDDYVRVIGKGLARSKLDADGNVVRRLPYGRHYTGITKAGLSRENTYVGNYGDTLNYAPEYVYKTLGHEGDEALHEEILKLSLRMIHARGFTRYTSVDANGNRVMRLEQVVDERNGDYPGQEAYATRVSFGVQLLWASLEKYMADNAERFSGAQWAPYWGYAAEAVGFAQQQLADNQYFNNWSAVAGKNKYDLWLAGTYAYVTRDRAGYPRFGRVAAGKVLAQTDFAYYTPDQLRALAVDPADYERFAWVDIDNMFVSMRDGDTRIFGSLFQRQRGVAGNGRLHVLNGDHDHIVQIATANRFGYQDHYLRIDNIDADFMEDRARGDATLPQALAGEIAPIAHQPGIGTVVRDGFEADTPYSGYSDFLTARYGRYLFAVNTTRQEHGNERTFDLDVPGRATDLVSGRQVGPGRVRVTPETAMVLKLDGTAERLGAGHVDYAQALPGDDHAVVTWKAAAGAESYTIRRDGRVIASGVRGTSYADRKAGKGGHSYTVTAVNRHGSGAQSQAARLPSGDGRIGAVTRGRISGDERRVTIAGGDGRGLGDGNDHVLYERDTLKDSMLLKHRVLIGSGAISAKIDSHAGPMSGLMLRSDLSESTRYIYFGADADGKLVLRNRTRDSFHDWDDQRRSPLDAGITGYTAAEYPYLKLVRDFDSHIVRAWAGKDGNHWTFVGEMFTPFAEAVHAGVAAATDATFGDVRLEQHREGTLYARAERAADKVTLHWSKPDTAVRFNVYRTDGGGWKKVLSDALTFSYTDAEPAGKDTRYRVTTIGADGVERPGPTIK